MTMKYLSGLEMYDFLKSKNIKNVEFLNVKGVPESPWESESLSKLEKDFIVEKCRNDLWYFINFVRIPIFSKVGDLAFNRFGLNIQNLSVLYLLNNNENVYNNVSRYSGATVTRIVFYLWKMINDPDFILTIIDTNMNSAVVLKHRIHSISQVLPSYLQAIVPDVLSRINVIVVDGIKGVEVEKKVRALAGTGGSVLINNFEFITNIQFVLNTLLPLESTGTIKMDCCSGLADNRYVGKQVADRLILNSIRWYIEMLDININKEFYSRDDFPIYYVKYNYETLVTDPEEYVETFEEFLHFDQNRMNTEIYLNR